MSQNSVVAFGEALIDFSSKDGAYVPYTGGAPANVAAAVSKLGVESYFVGSVGNDFFGEMIKSDLEKNNTKTDYCLSLDQYPTAAAYVTLDDSGERSFAFSRHDTADMNFPIDQLPVELLREKTGVFHFGSNSLTTEYQSAITMALVGLAKQFGWKVSFDVNLRENLWPAPGMNLDRIKKFASVADYIKLSDEEFETLVDLDQFKDLSEREMVFTSMPFSESAVVVITSGPGEIKLFTKDSDIVHVPAKVKAVDTTGAGDAFFGGFVYYIAEHSCFGNEAESYSEAIAFAAKCGAYSVQHFGAISSYPEMSDLT